ncbi:MAG: hypothetical protein ACKVRN_04020 [Pyrinomonadaceae bacterium]
MKEVKSPTSVRPFIFESYGVNVKIDGNLQETVDASEALARRCLLNCLRPVNKENIDQTFYVRHNKSGYYILHHNEKKISRGRSRKKFFKLFDSVIRAVVGENSPERVFLHAGVVGWNGTAIVIPGDSFRGKSTLVAELVRQGAEYYSDDFAIFDENGFVHPFPRNLAMRSDDGRYRPYELTVESLGGVQGSGSLPVGLVLFTQYEPGKRWRPQISTAGNGVLQMIPFALTFGNRPEFSLRVLNNVASRAIIASSPRGAAEEFAQKILDYVDNNAI